MAMNVWYLMQKQNQVPWPFHGSIASEKTFDILMCLYTYLFSWNQNFRRDFSLDCQSLEAG